MVLESLIGDTLINNEGAQVKTTDLSTANGGVIGLYFSAHWCPPCRGFTPTLAGVYKELKAANRDFEVVFISGDRNKAQFTEYHAEMPWLAMPPYDQSDETGDTKSASFSSLKDALEEKYEVNGIPALVLLEADTGNTITIDGRTPVDSNGAAAFPFSKERLAEVEQEAKIKKEELLKGMADLKLLGELATFDEPDKVLDLNEVVRTSEALAFAFMDGEGCRGSELVLPKLLDIEKKLGRDKLRVIVIPMMNKGVDDDGDEASSDFEASTKEKLKDVITIPRGERAKAVAAQFATVLDDVDAPHVFVVDARDASAMKILAENAARDIYSDGEAAFPWSSEAIALVKEQAAEMKKKIKEKQKNLEFFAESDSCHVVDKTGAAVPLATLQAKDVVGIYFSGHWCGPCRYFTPKLVEMYNACQEKGKSFEVVFVSSDRDQASFDEYYAEMPWCALSFDDRSLKEALSEVFDVEGIPTFVILKGDGELITEDGRSATNMGADFHPWNEEAMKKGKAEEAERELKKEEEAKAEEEKCYTEQEAAGKIVIRRHIGTADQMKIGTDHVIQFEGFSTVAAPSAVVPIGKKAWYEVTFKEGDGGISQIGWASTDGFEKNESYSGDGVGDCDHSYGFDGQRQSKWNSGPTTWGAEFEPKGDAVLGVGVDTSGDGETGTAIWFGLNGDWSSPMGVAFEGVNRNMHLYPALTGSSLTVFVNFGGTDMKYGPPDDSFEKLIDVIGK